MKQYSVDRIEEHVAVLIDECEKTKMVSLDSLPTDITETDILIFDGETYQVSKDETDARKKEIGNLMDSLFR